ncbi:hypothetical protein EMIT0P12_20366 [Pseudomonas sp. IT-P12]
MGASPSERVARRQRNRSVLGAHDQMEGHLHLLIDGIDLEATNHHGLALTRFSRLSGHFFRHFRVIRCDFTES